jgi:phosphoribosylanthranilate isomerase
LKTLDWKIKICGVVSVHDARMAIEAGAEAIGLNFFARSLRCVDPESARAIAASTAGSTVARVGVFVNHDPVEILRFAEECRLDWVQFHGDETPDAMDLRNRLPAAGFIRALRPASGEFATALESALAWHRAGIDAILLDAPRRPPRDANDAGLSADDPDTALYGGTGRPADWKLARDLVNQLPIPVILAGGLTPDNVAAAITAVCPAAVDAASGVESFPGRKSPDLVRRFVGAVRRSSTQQVGIGSPQRPVQD